MTEFKKREADFLKRGGKVRLADAGGACGELACWLVPRSPEGWKVNNRGRNPRR
jgi:hypothetical protein